MKPDEFEDRLMRQPQRQIPAEWRDEILAVARRASNSAKTQLTRHSTSAWRSTLSTLNSQLSTLLWPRPQAWAALGAIWLGILVMHFADRDRAAATAQRLPAPSPAVARAFKEQEQLLTELIGPPQAREDKPPKPSAPSPRSERSDALLRV